MKYKLMGVAGAVLILLTAAWASALEPAEKETTRIHQHLAARRDTGCDCGGAELCSHLPLVILDTGGQEIPGALTGETDRFLQPIYTMAKDGSTTIYAEIRVIDNQDRNNHLDDAPDFVTGCRLRIRGNSSRHFPKKPYAVSFVDESGLNRDLPVMGMGAHHDWVLHGPSLDKSLIRNYMWYNISGEIMCYAPNCRYCEVVLNGEYQGIYLMVETITDGDNCRLNLKMNVKGAQGTGYVIRSDRPVEEDLGTDRDIYSFLERTSTVYEDLSIRYPGRNTLTPELAKSIELNYAAFEKALFSYDYDSEDYGYRAWIDVGNFVDYYIINEFAGNVDAGGYSTYIYKELGEPFRLCVWDFNNSCDNFRWFVRPAGGLAVRDRAWYFMLFKDQAFVQQVLKRYANLRETWLSDEYILNYIDETVEFLGPAIARNNARWPLDDLGANTLNDPERDPDTYAEALEQIKTWLTARGNWLDGNIHTLQQYAHPSRNKPYNHKGG